MVMVKNSGSVGKHITITQFADNYTDTTLTDTTLFLRMKTKLLQL